ncbi:MAG: transposase [Rhodospirillales bacterium]|nr:transposase [Rhodospirillales bacterium]
MELLARGLSVRDIEDVFKDETGRLLLSRTAVSEIGERLWADYQEFASRDLGGYDVAYLFIDGGAERIRHGSKHGAEDHLRRLSRDPSLAREAPGDALLVICLPPDHGDDHGPRAGPPCRRLQRTSSP